MTDLLNDVRAVLLATPGRWTALAEGLPAALLARAPLPGEWSALDCLRHLIDTERDVFPARIKALLAGRDFPAFDPGEQGSPASAQLPGELAQAFARLRAASLEVLSGVTPGDLGRRARHAELGLVTMAELLNEWAAHDLMHTVQAERALMQPFIAGSGPWRAPYFADHDAEQQARSQ